MRGIVIAPPVAARVPFTGDLHRLWALVGAARVVQQLLAQRGRARAHGRQGDGC